MSSIKIKRIYEAPDKSDGYRILVDRLWPRGIKKEYADIDEWSKDVAPSSELREWFGHDSEKFKEFTARYSKELHSKKEVLKHIVEIAKKHKARVVNSHGKPLFNIDKIDEFNKYLQAHHLA